MNKGKFNLNKWVRNWIQRNNIDHSHAGRLVASGHNRSDEVFLKGNNAKMLKLQQKMS